MRTNHSKAILTFLFLLVLSLSWSVITDYTFTSTNGVYSEITDGAIHGTVANDNEVFNDIPIGFVFNYNTIEYSSISIATNGFIAMGPSVVTTNTPLSTGTTNNVISPFGCNLKSRTDGTLTSGLSGEAPNRVFTIQWHNYRRFHTNAANDTLNFQIKMFEGLNTITYNYGHCYVVLVTTAATLQCGLRGAANTEFLNRMTTTDWSATTSGTANNSTCTINNTVYPPNGLIYNWAPALVPTIPNPAEIVSPANGSIGISLTSNLHWQSGGGVVTGYKVFLGTDNPPTNIVNGTLQTPTTYNPVADFVYQTVYYWQIIPTNTVGDAINCPVWSFTSMPDPIISVFPHTENWDLTTAPAVPPSWTVVNANNDAFTWLTNTSSPFSAPNALRCSYNTSSAIPMDDWAISPPLLLEAGSYYKIQFYFKAHSNILPEKLEVKFGTSNNVASLTTQIYSNTNITNTSYSMGEAYFPVTAGGTYYFGFHGFSDANMYNLYIDDVAISHIIPVFNPPTNLTAVFGGSSIVLSWQVPVGSVPSGYKVFRDESLLTPTPIASHTYTDNTASAGIHNYYVTAAYINPIGESTPTNTVSGEILRPVSNLQFTVVRDTVSLSWTPPISRNGNRSITGYNVYRDFSVIANITDIAVTNYIDSGQPNGSYIYWITAVYTSGESDACPFITANVFVPIVPTFYTDGFESYSNFALNFGNWILHDEDNSATITFDAVDFTNEGNPMAFMIFNPTATTPLLTNVSAHTGQRMAASIASTTPPNNDWMITPRMRLGTENAFSFWARSANNVSGLERFRVGISIDDNPTPDTFTMLSGNSYVEAPVEWTHYTYQVPVTFNAARGRFGIKCESNNAYMFLVDDIVIQGYNGVPNEDAVIPVTETALLGNYPNPFNPETIISYDVKNDAQINIEIYNIKGQKIKTLVNGKVKAGNHKITWKGDDENGRQVTSGVYFYKLNAGMYTSTRKMILMK